jgi:D-alanyl-D-alanine dipeptidase
MTPQDRPNRLLETARSIAAAQPDFQVVRGPGDGDRATHAFMRQLRERAAAAFGVDCAEQKICGSTSFAADFYFPEEATVVEVALGLPNPGSEFEKDILKAIMAQDYGYAVRRLVFISRAGAVKKCAQPGRAAIIAWARAKHALEIEVHELGGEPRKRTRRLRSAASNGSVR